MGQDVAWPTLSVQELARRIAVGEIRAETVLEAVFERVERLDVGPDGLHSILALNPDAPAEARARDADRQRSGPQGPLHGIPVVVKDNIATADSMPTTAGARVLQEFVAPTDATVVERLRAAGAVIVGKSNLTEWANWVSDHMPNGFSAVGGQTRNPFGPGRFDTGGSSAGSAVAVAAGIVPAAIGTETSGSILSPASQNGLVGVKPTVGLVSRFGVIPISHSQDTVGPMTRTVEDAALLLEVLAGPDPNDASTLAAPMAHDYVRASREGVLTGVRLGVPRHPYWERLSEARRSVAERALAVAQAHGAMLLDPVVIPSADREWGLEILTYEFKAALARFFARMGPQAPVRTLREVIAYNERHPEAIPYGQARLLASDAANGRLTDPAYLSARRRYTAWARAEGLDAALTTQQVDALVFVNASGAFIAACAGYPSITVPVGTTEEGEPVGLTLTGRAFDEGRLFAWAGALERALAAEGLGRRDPPVFGGAESA